MAIEGNIENGAKLFKARCAHCHAVEKGGSIKLGPNFWGIFGSKMEGLAVYPEACKPKSPKVCKDPKEYKSGECLWSEEALFEFMENPKKYNPGTKMAFAALKDPQDRADLVAYLKIATQKEE